MIISNLIFSCIPTCVWLVYSRSDEHSSQSPFLPTAHAVHRLWRRVLLRSGECHCSDGSLWRWLLLSVRRGQAQPWQRCHQFHLSSQLSSSGWSHRLVTCPSVSRPYLDDGDTVYVHAHLVLKTRHIGLLLPVPASLTLSWWWRCRVYAYTHLVVLKTGHMGMLPVPLSVDLTLMMVMSLRMYPPCL